MICGTSGAGKTSLIRSLLGLWVSHPSGTLLQWDSINSEKDVLVIPQASYLPRGNLIQQICYPRDWTKCQDLHRFSTVSAILTEVGLKCLLDKGENRHIKNHNPNNGPRLFYHKELGVSVAWSKTTNFHGKSPLFTPKDCYFGCGSLFWSTNLVR